MITYPETQLLGNATLFRAGSDYWLLAPVSYYDNRTREGYVSSTGSGISSAYVSNSYGVRPVISLAPGVEYDKGDGSMEHPYKIVDGTN